MARTDLHLINGTWEPVDLFADCPPDLGLDEHLRSKGWVEFLTLGPANSAMWIVTWEHPASGHYLFEVNDSSTISPHLWVDTFAELAELMAKWAPIVQAAVLAEAVNDLADPRLIEGGLVETIASRAVFGAGEHHRSMVREDERRRERNQTRR